MKELEVEEVEELEMRKVEILIPQLFKKGNLYCCEDMKLVSKSAIPDGEHEKHRTNRDSGEGNRRHDSGIVNSQILCNSTQLNELLFPR